MRLAVIGHKQIPGRSGGVEVVVEELAPRVVARGISVTVYNRKIKGRTSPRSFKGAKLVDIPTPDSKNLNAVVYSYLATIRAILDGTDVIHYHALGPSASLWLAKLFGKKVVVTVHGLNYKTPKWKGFGARYIKFGERITMKSADAVIVLSKGIRDHFKREYGRETQFIPNGLSMPAGISDDSVLDRFDLRGTDFLLCVSRLVPGKGLETLVEAFRGVKTDARLVIAGDSDHVDEFKNALKKSAESDPRILFTGFLNRDELAALYSNARLFVFPSEAEGMPMALLEAMWFNCPCLVSDIPENTEVLEGHGSTFPVGDVAGLRQAISHVVPAWPERVNTRDIVAEEHDWDVVADKTVGVFQEVFNDRAR